MGAGICPASPASRPALSEGAHILADLLNDDDQLTIADILERLQAEQGDPETQTRQRWAMILGQLLGDPGLGQDIATGVGGTGLADVAAALTGGGGAVGGAPAPPNLGSLRGLVGGQGLPTGGGLGETVDTRGAVSALPSPGNFDQWGQSFDNASVPIGQAGEYLTAVRQDDGSVIYLRPDVAANLVAMERKADRQGVDLVAGEGYRDWDAQAAADARHGPGLAASAGSSNHGMGAAVDFSNYDHDWLARNAERFGFYQPMDYEPWHWQPLTAESGGYTEGESMPTLYAQPTRELYERLGTPLPGSTGPQPGGGGQRGGGIPATQGDFARRLLGQVEAPRTPGNLDAVLSWMQAEEEPTPGFNPLNTTQGGGSPTQAFGSFREGVGQTAATLTNGLYDPVLEELREGDDPLGVLHAIQESPWAAGGYGGSLPSVLAGLSPEEASQVLGTRRGRIPVPAPIGGRRRGPVRGYGQRA